VSGVHRGQPGSRMATRKYKAWLCHPRIVSCLCWSVRKGAHYSLSIYPFNLFSVFVPENRIASYRHLLADYSISFVFADIRLKPSSSHLVAHSTVSCVVPYIKKQFSSQFLLSVIHRIVVPESGSRTAGPAIEGGVEQTSTSRYFSKTKLIATSIPKNF
jgi:hypothetical protein